ncbi:NADH-quinone oxidoreductase subunit K [bacterium]|nr:NADH-quinone oxidoreductase subunit K [bacterium]
MNAGTLYLGTGFALVLVGLSCALLKRNLVRMVLGFSIVDTGIHLVIASVGSLSGRTAPIIDDPALFSDTAALVVSADKIVDPVPQALVLTAIVIGVGVTALMLAYIVRLHDRNDTLDVRELRELKW